MFALDGKLFPGLRHLLQSVLVIWLSHQLCQFAAFVRIYSVFGHGARPSVLSIIHIRRPQKSIRPQLIHRAVRAKLGSAGLFLNLRLTPTFQLPSLPEREHANNASRGYPQDYPQAKFEV